MAGITPLVPPRTGVVDGKLEIKTEASLTLNELLTYRPAAEAFLDELSERGWRYYFIDGYGTVLKEMEISSPYTFLVQEHPRGGLTYTLTIDFGRAIPNAVLKDIISLDRFIVNICSQHYPRGVTVDLTKNEVTYVHESLWVSKGEGCKEEARDVLKMLQWLIEEKKFKLGMSDGEKYYRELVTLLGGK